MHLQLLTNLFFNTNEHVSLLAPEMIPAFLLSRASLTSELIRQPLCLSSHCLEFVMKCSSRYTLFIVKR